MKHCTAVQEGCGYKDTLRAHRYFAPSAKYFTVRITYQTPLVFYCTYYRLNMFRALLCPSSGALDYDVDYNIGRSVLGFL